MGAKRVFDMYLCIGRKTLGAHSPAVYSCGHPQQTLGQPKQNGVRLVHTVAPKIAGSTYLDRDRAYRLQYRLGTRVSNSFGELA